MSMRSMGEIPVQRSVTDEHGKGSVISMCRSIHSVNYASNVAAIMALDRCVRNQTEPQGSVYDERGLLVF